MSERIYRSVAEHLSLGVCGTLSGIKTHLSFLTLDERGKLFYRMELKHSEGMDELAWKLWEIKKTKRSD